MLGGAKSHSTLFGDEKDIPRERENQATNEKMYIYKQ
jgi:hypothetical protein